MNEGRKNLDFSGSFQDHRRGAFAKAVFYFLAILLLVPPASYAQVDQKDSSTLNKSPKITLDVKGMNVVDVLKILADEGGLNLSVSGNVKGRITLFLKDIDVWDAFEIVIISSDLAYEEKGEIIYIMPQREYELKYGKAYWDVRVLEVFSLKYTKAAKVGAIFSQIASKIGKVIIDESSNNVVVLDIPVKIAQMQDVVANVDRPLVTRVFSLNYLPAPTIQESLKEYLSPEIGSLSLDELTNKIVIIDYPEKIRELEKMIAAFDEKPLQVLIDAKIVEIRPSKKFYAGVNWDYWIQRYFQVQGVFSIPTTSNNKLTYGTISSGDVEQVGDYTGILEFLEMFGETKILSTPRILALNNQEAKILVGSKEAYITSTVSQADGSSVTSQTVNFVDVGVKLYVTPTINRAGYVTLKIRPEISSAETQEITSEDKITEIPIVSTSEAETTVIVRDGVSIIIGGLKKITRTNESEQVPILGSIPLFGIFFKSKKDEWIKNELVILLTPHIVSGDKSIEMELMEKEEALWHREALDEIERLKRERGTDKAEAAKPKELKEEQAKAQALQPEVSVPVRPAAWEKEEIAKFQRKKAEEAMLQQKVIGEYQAKSNQALLESQTLAELRREKAKEVLWEQEALLEFEKMRLKAMQEKETLDEFIAMEQESKAGQ
jgi:type II secretory pathway component GspD/PulD (secretin)